jgi:hypothetical protein
MANANIAEVNFAAMADALEKPTSCLPEMALAAYLEMLAEGETRKHLEHQAARFGYNPAGTNRLLNDATERARALNKAHRFILALIPHERQIQALLGA